jgi:hypothetical protein
VILQELIDSAHFTELMAEEKLEPRGQSRADFRAAITSSVIANANRSKNQKPFKPSDFMPDFTGERSKFNPQSLANKLKAMAAARNRN